MKKFLLGFVLLSSFAITVEAKIFVDVPNDILEYQAITVLSDRGIINGYNDGSFGGLNKVTRAELSKILLLASKKNLRQSGFSKTFSDVTTDTWFYPYVNSAAGFEIVSGYPDGSFKPLAEVNTAEFLKMVSKTFNLTEGFSYDYEDVNLNDWFSVYAGLAQAKKLFPLRSNQYLEPNRPMTRYEVVYALYQLLDTDKSTLLTGLDNNRQIERPTESTQKNSQTVCLLQSSQLCVEDQASLESFVVLPDTTDVVLGDYLLFSPESTARFVSFEVVTNFSVSPTVWLEQDGKILTTKKMLENSRLELSMNPSLLLGNKKSLQIKMDVPSGVIPNDFIKIRLLYLDNVWQNQTGDIGQYSRFGSKVVIK